MVDTMLGYWGKKGSICVTEDTGERKEKRLKGKSNDVRMENAGFYVLYHILVKREALSRPT